ncbi:MAG: GGDEF domain-containing protein [Clostridia bacterium]
MKKIIIPFIILLTMLTVGGTLFLNSATTNLKDSKITYLSEISIKNASLIKTKINDLLDLLKADALFISHVSEKSEVVNIEESLKVLKQEAKRNEFKRMGIILKDGKTYLSDNDEVKNFSERDYFKDAIKGNSVVSQPLIDVLDGSKINVLSTPIYKGNEIIGVLFGTIDASMFSKVLEVVSFGGEGYSYIITSKGIPIIYPTHKYGMRGYDDLFSAMRKEPENEQEVASLEQNISDGLDGNMTYYYGNIKRELSYSKIGINDWYMISIVPTSVIMQNSNDLLFQMAIIAIIMVLIIMAISIIVINSYRKNATRLETLAFKDEITGFYNYKKFKIEARRLLNIEDLKYAFVYFDIKNFKIVNDIYGFEKGNDTLKYICNILMSNKKKDEVFARVAADRFVYLMRYTEEEEILNSIRLLNDNICNYIDDYTMTLTFGVRIINDNKDIDTYYDNAMLAIMAGASNSNENITFYNDSFRTSILKEKEYENAMQTSLDNNEFKVFLQPKYNIKTGKIVGAEALCRWDYKNNGLIFPDQFIPLFEKNGFIKTLDLYMFESVCKLLSYLKENDKKSIVISTNFSRYNSINLQTAKTLNEITKKYKVPTSLLEVEITESALTDNINEFIDITKSIKSQGFLLSIDDFGAGYSSLNCLKDIPADIIKLDREFLHELSDNERGRKIIESLVQMAKLLSLTTIAEGVETKEHVEFLKSIGCDMAQGYYYAKPMPIDAFLNILEAD